MPFRKPHQTSDPRSILEDNMGRYVIQPKGLNIIWGNDLRYWKITPDNNAELIQVSWLEVSSKVAVQRGKTYKVKFDVEVKENGFGWDNTPVLVMARIGKNGSYQYKEVKLVCGSQTIPEGNELLSIAVQEQERDLELHFGLCEVWSGKWKGGLVIKKAEFLRSTNYEYLFMFYPCHMSL